MNYLRTLLEGSTVTLELDIARIYGKYRRILAVVYAAGRCVQLDLLEKGHARVMLGQDNAALNKIMPEDLPPGGSTRTESCTMRIKTSDGTQSLQPSTSMEWVRGRR